MKHHDVFIPILREHNALMVLGEMMQAGEQLHPALSMETSKKAEFAIDRYWRQLAPYLMFEEEDLFPRLEGTDPEMDQLLYVLRDNNTEITDMFRRLESDVNQESLMDTIGKLLVQHLDMVEKELFPMCEKHFSDTDIWELSRPYKR